MRLPFPPKGTVEGKRWGDAIEYARVTGPTMQEVTRVTPNPAALRVADLPLNGGAD
jgi:hypothetical protein